jgi:DNA-binding SARP family transcriptional activator
VSLRLRLFGPPSLTDRDGRTPGGLGPGKPLAVLCYLAREGEVRRETVTALLWGTAPEARARNAFRQALHRLRAALGDHVVPHDPDTVRIAATADLAVDVADFERALAEGRPEDAIELVTGDFLDGFTLGEPGFDHWADGQRARLRIRYLGALRDAAHGALAAGRLDDAVRHAARLARADPLDSSSALLEARALAAAGQGFEALSRLREHAARFREEVGEEPPEEVAAAVDGLAREGVGGGNVASVSGSERGLATAGAGGGVGSAGSAGASGAPGAAGSPGSGVVDGVARAASQEVLGRLLVAWRAAMAEECSVVVLEGAAGSDKSWLIDELVRRVKPLDQPLVLRGAERMGAHGLPYAPVAEALRGVLRARGLGGASTHLLAEAARLVPELRDRFDLPAVTPVSDRTERLRFYEGVASVVDAVAYEQPVLMALEGVHESDERTLELVHFLATRLGDARVLFVLSGKPGRALTGLVRRLGERAERVVLDPPSTLPVVLEDALRPRIEALSPRERRVLTLLALVHRPLPVGLLASCTHLPDGAVVEVVESLERAGLARDGERGAAVSDERVAELARSNTGPAARALLAGWAADALAAERAAPDAELAELSALAGRPEAAARYAEAAARAAVELGARDVAADRLREALEWTTDPAVRARLERLLAAVGERSRWLGAGLPINGAASRPPPRTRVMVLAAAAVVVLALVALTRVEPPPYAPTCPAGWSGTRSCSCAPSRMAARSASASPACPRTPPPPAPSPWAPATCLAG